MSGGTGFLLGLLFGVFLFPTVLHLIEGGIGNIGNIFTGGGQGRAGWY